MRTLTITTDKNSFLAKEDLKKVGFVWNAKLKRWESESPDMEKWYNDFCRMSYCGKRAKINQTIDFGTIVA